MSSPFLREFIIDEGANIVRRALRRERVFRDRQDPLGHSDAYLYERYRFSREGIIYLQQLLGKHIANCTERSVALTVTQTLCIGLRFLATGTFLFAVGDAEKMSKSTVCRAIRKVYLALKRYLNAFIVFPGHVQVNTIKEGFCAISAFPNVLGVVDCTHIPIKAPTGPHERDFISRNRKCFHSINVQLICDSSCLITNVEAKWPGAVCDSRIFQESSLCSRFEEGLYDGVLLGDRGYACRPFLLTPYRDPTPGPQAGFNQALAKAWTKMETTCGLLKERFQCLAGLRVAPDRACDIIAACAVLHNIATIRKERVPSFQLPAKDDAEPVCLDQPSGIAERDKMASQYFC